MFFYKGIPGYIKIYPFFNKPESGNPFHFLNQTIIQVLPFPVKIVNQLNLPCVVSYLNQKKKWIPAFAGMTC
jgi:hypothetical protein